MNGWTEEELDLMHPLPDGWLWSKRGLNTWCARKAEGGGWMDVWVAERRGTGAVLANEHVPPVGMPRPFEPPVDVALAVLMAYSSRAASSVGADGR